MAVLSDPSLNNKVESESESVKVQVAQSSLTLCDPMDFIVHGILQARILEWVAFPFSREGNPSPSLQTYSLPAEPQGKPKNTGVGSISLLQCIFPTQESNWGLLHCRRFFTNWAIRESLNKVDIMSNVIIVMLGGLNEIMHIKPTASFKHRASTQ